MLFWVQRWLTLLEASTVSASDLHYTKYCENDSHLKTATETSATRCRQWRRRVPCCVPPLPPQRAADARRHSGAAASGREWRNCACCNTSACTISSRCLLCEEGCAASAAAAAVIAVAAFCGGGGRQASRGARRVRLPQRRPRRCSGCYSAVPTAAHCICCSGHRGAEPTAAATGAHCTTDMCCSRARIQAVHARRRQRMAAAVAATTDTAMVTPAITVSSSGIERCVQQGCLRRGVLLSTGRTERDGRGCDANAAAAAVAATVIV